MKNRILALFVAISAVAFPAIASAHARHFDNSTYESRHNIGTTVRYSSFTNKYMANDPRYAYEYNQIHAQGYVAPAASAPCAARNTDAEYIRATALTYARSAPNAGSKVLRMVVHGNNFQVMGQTGGWYAVNIPNYDGTAWVPKSAFEKAL